MESEQTSEGLGVGVAVGVGVTVADRLIVGVIVGVGVKVAVTLGVGVGNLDATNSNLGCPSSVHVSPHFIMPIFSYINLLELS